MTHVMSFLFPASPKLPVSRSSAFALGTSPLKPKLSNQKQLQF